MPDKNDNTTMLVNDICCEKKLLLGTRFRLSHTILCPTNLYKVTICESSERIIVPSFAQFIQLVSVATK